MFESKRPSGLTAHAALAALGPARALTSYARKVFAARYRGRHRLPSLVFAFDALLLLTALTLLGLAGWIWIAPPAPPALSLSMTALSLVSAAPVSAIFRLRAAGLPAARLPPASRLPAGQAGTGWDGQGRQGGKLLTNVSLDWRAPPGTEILKSDKAMTPAVSGGSVYIGDLAPGREFASHVLLRLFQAAGTDAQFAFTVRYDENGSHRELVGLESRPVVRSALTVSVPPAFRADAIPSSGTIIPLQVENQTDEAMPFVEIALDPPHPVWGERIILGDLAPREKRFVFMPVASRLSWVGSAAARELTRGSWSAPPLASGGVADWNALRITATGISRPGRDFVLGLEGARAGMKLLIVHPLLSEPIRSIDLAEGQTEARISVPPTAANVPAREWIAVPSFTSPSGLVMLGPATVGRIGAPFPFSAEARYASPSGDQLGAGPNPPQAGFETRYWVFWKAGPVDGELRNVRVSASLSSSVRFTGNASAPNGGDWSVSGREVSWTLPRLSSSSGQNDALFGFEIAVRPTSRDVGRVLSLLATSTAVARDPDGGIVEAAAAALMSDTVEP